MSAGFYSTFTIIFISVLHGAHAASERPTFILEPENPVYIVGDSVAMRCLAENPTTISSYEFYKDGAKISEYRNDNRNHLLRINSITKQNEGFYFCNYVRANISAESNSVKFNVIERPYAPSLIVDPPQMFYFTGQSVTLRCLVRKDRQILGIFIYKNGIQVDEADNFGVLIYANIRTINAGNFSCAYTLSESNLIVQSAQTKVTTLVVTDPLPSPSLRFYPNLPEIQGREIKLLCESPKPSTIRGYRFYKNGNDLTRGAMHLENVFIITNYNNVSEGCYFCVAYRIEQGIEIPSAESNSLFLTSNGRSLRHHKSPLQSCDH
ncbi:immunoglobulin superfamily member 1 [Bombina bombina]|uniref:immunoglobulin superfamily member 1 n=1 Tax=Bombina bombina TaxID=8345 RepID=UPI00235A86E3|nr:immunoglobulin superfamily member 1 [Bombina bombina]